MIQLHYYPSTAAMAPHVLLEEIGAPFELVLVDRAQGVHKAQQYLRLNPNGLIPVLTDGDLVLYESAAICLHLCDRHPEAGLAPALGTAERAHFYKWLMWLTNTLQATLIVYFYPERWMNAGNPAGAAELKTHAEAKVRVLLGLLDAELARHGGPWLLGDHYSAVDAYAMMLCRWTRHFGKPARNRPQLGPYLQRVLARPAVVRAFASEGLAQPWV
ncbi:glutathione S-transferase family protein [Polaromonas sp.]|uniref:glutathione S-transferase family protein n=1 Tax=Polaromonas sp. TaxID=1869339 RepID=UPI00286B4B2C|nr:glutathione S-transferase family protein [Polaromonas sp.]